MVLATMGFFVTNDVGMICCLADCGGGTRIEMAFVDGGITAQMGATNG